MKTFSEIDADFRRRILAAPAVKTEKWQGMDVRNNPAAVSYEIMNAFFEVDLEGIEGLNHWRIDIRPNLPWADDHFLERIGGHPLNPGREWANWPWGQSAARFRDKAEQFNHTYPERLWPKYARTTGDGILGMRLPPIRKGIAWTYGDLEDLVDLLVAEPHTRQAYIPLFFPEDTGIADGGRKPCTLGYFFLMREGRLNIHYPLRSCDLIRHWRDDCYLAVRLLLWVLEKCRRKDPGTWSEVYPGTYSMWMGSLHIFQNDRHDLQQ